MDVFSDKTSSFFPNYGHMSRVWLPTPPIPGVKGSGNGTRESGIWVIESYSYWHAVNDELSGKLQLAQMDVEEIELIEEEVDYSCLLYTSPSPRD